MELITLTTPVTTPSITTWRVSSLLLDWDAAVIAITLRGSGGERLSHTYTGANATAQMTALNKVNLTSNSLHKRIIQRLIDDGMLSGTISGSPD